jgi:hypothetical protein
MLRACQECMEAAERAGVGDGTRGVSGSGSKAQLVKTVQI